MQSPNDRLVERYNVAVAKLNKQGAELLGLEPNQPQLSLAPSGGERAADPRRPFLWDDHDGTPAYLIGPTLAILATRAIERMAEGPQVNQ